jgi:hypothetical protein
LIPARRTEALTDLGGWRATVLVMDRDAVVVADAREEDGSEVYLGVCK